MQLVLHSFLANFVPSKNENNLDIYGYYKIYACCLLRTECLCPSKFSHGSTNPYVLVFESGPFGRKFGLGKVMRRAPMMGLLPLKEEEVGPEYILSVSLCLSSMWGHSKKAARKGTLTKKWICWHFDLELLSLQNYEK